MTHTIIPVLSSYFSTGIPDGKGARGTETSSGSKNPFTGTWAVEIKVGGKRTADYIAKRHGFINMGKIQVPSYNY